MFPIRRELVLRLALICAILMSRSPNLPADSELIGMYTRQGGLFGSVYLEMSASNFILSYQDGFACTLGCYLYSPLSFPSIVSIRSSTSLAQLSSKLQKFTSDSIIMRIQRFADAYPSKSWQAYEMSSKERFETRELVCSSFQIL
ncbi:hypothetical protein C8R43DRAFT_335607 [Mycena crocata]|nr:hypothetical protein C8R43DRAFT_335607 [Mycena crocata]